MFKKEINHKDRIISSFVFSFIVILLPFLIKFVFVFSDEKLFKNITVTLLILVAYTFLCFFPFWLSLSSMIRLFIKYRKEKEQSIWKKLIVPFVAVLVSIPATLIGFSTAILTAFSFIQYFSLNSY